jgi:putative transposase
LKWKRSHNRLSFLCLEFEVGVSVNKGHAKATNQQHRFTPLPKSPSLTIDDTDDHLHILFSLGRVVRVADLVEEAKTESSKWIKTKGREFRNFHWPRGYGAFSIGQSNVSALKRYIRNQKQHHRQVTFQDEYRKFLKAYGIDDDERYVWD